VPEEIAEKLRKRNHRSLQGELMAILEESVMEEATLTLKELLERIRAMGLQTPQESVKFIREDRDSRSGR
jgi:hypothetical protein